MSTNLERYKQQSMKYLSFFSTLTFSRQIIRRLSGVTMLDVDNVSQHHQFVIHNNTCMLLSSYVKSHAHNICSLNDVVFYPIMRIVMFKSDYFIITCM